MAEAQIEGAAAEEAEGATTETDQATTDAKATDAAKETPAKEGAKTEAKAASDTGSDGTAKDDSTDGAAREEIKLSAPEGQEILQADFDTFAKQAGEIGLTNEQANALAKWQVDRVKEAAEANSKTIEGWAEEARADKEIGGDAFDQNAAVARKAIDAFGDDSLKEILDASGMGNHPAVIRAFWKIGKHLSDTKFQTGEGGSVEKADDVSILYPSTR